MQLSKASILPLLALLFGAATASILRKSDSKVKLACGPQTKINLPIGKTAAGHTVWSPPFFFTKGEPQPIGRNDVESARICGPGKFYFSATSCENIQYKPDVFTQSKEAVTTDCQEVALPTAK